MRFYDSKTLNVNQKMEQKPIRFVYISCYYYYERNIPNTLFYILNFVYVIQTNRKETIFSGTHKQQLPRIQSI